MPKGGLNKIKSLLTVVDANIRLFIVLIIFLVILQYTNAFDRKSIILECFFGVALVVWTGNHVAVGVITYFIERRSRISKFTEEVKAQERRADEYRELINDQLTE